MPDFKIYSIYKVIPTRFNTVVTVIFVMWQTAGGLRRVGFSKVR